MFLTRLNRWMQLVKRFRSVDAAWRLARQEDGAAAIEFAFVAAPFFALLLAIIQTAFVLYAGQVLETAAADSARLIKTGQAQNQGLNASTFKNEVCARISGLFDCQAGVYVDVRTYTSFASISTALPLDANGNLVDNFTYDPGKSGEIVVARLIYKWPIYATLLNIGSLANMAGSNRIIIATSAFRNEPF